MVSQAGILPTPNSPGIKNGDISSYIKRSYYPIPYQAIIALENCDIHELLSWDINVSVKSIKIKVEWSTAKSNGNIELLPKAVYNSIASYNLTQPTWSSSFNNQSLSLKVEWKIADPKQNINSTPNQVPVTVYPGSPRLYAPPSGFPPNTPNYKHNDSGYASSPYTSTPTARSFPFRHDVYRTPPIPPVITQSFFKTPSPPFKTTSNLESSPSDQFVSSNFNPKLHQPKPPTSSSSESVPTTSTNTPVDTTLLKPNIVDGTPSIINIATTQTVDPIKPPNPPESESPYLPDSPAIPTTSTNTLVDTTIPKPNIVHETLSITNTSTTQTVESESPHLPDSSTISTTSTNTLVHETPSITPVDTTIPKPNIVHETPSITNTSTTQTVDPIKPPNPPESESPHLFDASTIPDPRHVEYPSPQPYPPSDHNPSSNASNSRKRKKKNKKNKNSYVGLSPALISGSPSNNTIMNEVQLIATDPKFVVHKDSTDDDIMLIPDPLNEDANPGDDLFIKTPDDLKIDDRGLINASLKACWMDLQGRCRMCEKIVKSYDVDEHILMCEKFNENDLTSFVRKIAKNIRADQYDVKEQVVGYCVFELDEEYTNQIFPSVASYKQFVNDVEHFLNDRATIVFQKCKIYGLQSRSNILNFKSQL